MRRTLLLASSCLAAFGLGSAMGAASRPFDSASAFAKATADKQDGRWLIRHWIDRVDLDIRPKKADDSGAGE
jgi:hypothetical protein